MAKPARSGLGRGLGSLLGDSYEKPAAAPAPPVAAEPAATPASQSVPTETTAELEPVVVERDTYTLTDIDKAVSDDVSLEDVVPVVREEAVVEAPVEVSRIEEPAVQAEETPTMEEVIERKLNEVPLDAIEPNPDQPRTSFKREELEELADSIAKEGLLQPILVRSIGEGKYQIIAGERRWQACQLLDLKTVPVTIKDADDMKALELALIENLQRSDLNPIEEAYGYRRLMERNSMSQADVAQAMSKGRSTIANALRLLDLPEDAQQLLFEDKIQAGHARAILSIPTREGRHKLTKRLREQKMSVREAEQMARLLAGKPNPNAVHRDPMPASYKSVAKTLRDVLKRNVRVKSSKGKNKIEIEFKDERDLEKLFESLIPGE